MFVEQLQHYNQKSVNETKFTFRDTFAKSRGLTFGHGSKKFDFIDKMNPLESFGDLNKVSKLSFVQENDDDQDIDFIEEIVKGYQQDLDLQEQIYTIVKNAFDVKDDLSPEDRTEILADVEAHQDNFVKVLTYAGFLLE